ncbi:MAG: hypothetical protein WD512_14430 [Candidatus Paceibacterota bacterium]
MDINKNATKVSKVINRLIISCESAEVSPPYLRSQPIDIPRKQGIHSVMRNRNSKNSHTSDTSDTSDTSQKSF